MSQLFIEAIQLFNMYEKWLKPEAHEQARFVLYLEERGYKFTAIPNSTYTKSYKQKIVNALMGVRPGLCDMLVLLKRKQALVFFEMKLPREQGKRGLKKSKSNTDNEHQLSWIEELSKIDNVDAIMCFGCDDAIRVLEMAESVGTETK